MRYFLRALGARGARVQIAAGRVLTIGRAPDADIRLEDTLVSRHHCEVEVRGDGVIVRDLGSRNGTALDGKRFKGEVAAPSQSRLKVGSTMFLVEADDASAPPSETQSGIEREADDAGDADAGATEPAPAPARSERRDRTDRTDRDRTDRRRPTSAPAAPTPPPGAPRLPGFDIVAEISRGRTGVILRARRQEDGAEVAIKLVEPDPDDPDRAIERFQREARALQRLDHPNIVTIHEVNESAGLCWYVMEDVPGTTLAARLQDGPLGARDALSTAIQVANALSLAHREGVVHRDVSPRSIMLASTGIAKLFDFACVKSGDGRAGSLTGLGEIIGDLEYCSPEQATDPRQVDHRTDLYALGATLFHAMTGRPPLLGKTALETMRLIIGGKPPKLRDLAPGAPARAEAIIARLLAKAPDDRFASADELHAALEAALVEACALESQSGAGTISDAGGFGGAFAGMELVEIIQFLEFNKKDGVLGVSSPGLDGEVRLRGGRIVAARAGTLDGEGAVLALLVVNGGTFRFRPGEGPGPTGALALQPSILAVEAMRRRDERGVSDEP